MRARRLLSTSRAADLVVTSTLNGVRTIRMNRQARLNAWTQPMIHSWNDSFNAAAVDESVEAVIFTGAATDGAAVDAGRDEYYCAGADLSGLFAPKMPAALHAEIVAANESLFDAFLSFPKPLFAAVNGHAIGASVTSATLCDGVIASPDATFHTPFAALGVPPEGCSSVLFERIMGAEHAHAMLVEGWKPSAAEMLDAGFVQSVVPRDELLDAAQTIAEQWVASATPKRHGAQLAELKAVNAMESALLADAVFSLPFMEAQLAFARRRKKAQLVRFFKVLIATRPLWGLLLPAPFQK